jgi:alkylated DNA repair protein alkB family protein 4
LGSFSGLPAYSKCIVHAIQQLKGLNSFVPVEQCNLEYVPERGSAIDPHIDDEWLWGERLVTLNLLSDTVLTFTNEETDTQVLVPLPKLSLVIVSSLARHKWKHGINRRDIYNRRIAITFRELSDEFKQPGGVGEGLEQIALQFKGQCCP